MRFSLCSILSLTLLGTAQAHAAADKTTEPLQEVIVTATLRKQPLQSAPVSATVLTAETLHAVGQQHFQDVLALTPNLNWAAGTSRPRYFQIRGIGEREQYQGAPNPSVGFLIDDIDFSGLGMAATLFDVQQVEVLRGPQGTRYGANALAGLIAVRTADPADTFTMSATGSVADYDTRSLGVTASGPVESLNSAWRLAVQQYRSDGFREDDFLGR
ncbi:MAG: TonB-dependent receptor plug domain-containing protein, partial [Steroidobacteraceae bacterium]